MTKLSKAMIGFQAAAAAALLGAVNIWAPVCGKMLELTSGKEIPMKCHWTARAAIAVAVILLAASIMAYFSGKEHKKLMVVTGVIGVVIILLFTNTLMGVCASPDMRCQTTKLWGWGTGAVTIAASLIDLISGKEGQVPG